LPSLSTEPFAFPLPPREQCFNTPKNLMVTAPDLRSRGPNSLFYTLDRASPIISWSLPGCFCLCFFGPRPQSDRPPNLFGSQRTTLAFRLSGLWLGEGQGTPAGLYPVAFRNPYGFCFLGWFLFFFLRDSILIAVLFLPVTRPPERPVIWFFPTRGPRSALKRLAASD